MLKFLPRLLPLLLLCMAHFAPAQAQGCGPHNPNCIVPTGPPGTSNNQAASTAFVQQAIPVIPPIPHPGGTGGQIQYNNAGSFGGFTASGDFTINTATGVGTLNTVSTAKGGTGVGNATNAANDVLASNGTNGNFVHTALLTLLNAVCVVSPSGCSALFGYVSPYWYGAVCDGSTNDSTALQNMFTASSGKLVYFPPATCVVNQTLNVLASTHITGAGRNLAIIKQTGAAVTFSLSNVSKVTIENLYLLGTDSYVSWSVTNVGAIRVTNSAETANIVLQHLQLTGFNANYWISFGQSALTSNVRVEDILVDTNVADVPTDGVATNNTNGIIEFQSGAAGVRFENTVIANNEIHGNFACFGIMLFGNSFKYRITNNNLINLGHTNTNSHCTNGLGGTNTYGILVYDDITDGNPPSNGLIEANYCLSPAAACIYLAGDGVSTARSANSFIALVTGNLCVSQTQSDTLLPRGCVGISNATDISIIGNKFWTSQQCVAAAAQNAGVLVVRDNTCYSGAGGGLGIIMGVGNNGTSNTDIRVIEGNYVDVLTTGIIFQASTNAVKFSNAFISKNTISTAAAQTGIYLGSQYFSGFLSVNDNEIIGTGTPWNLGITGTVGMQNNRTTAGVTLSTLPSTAADGSFQFITDGAPASSPCTGTSTGSTAFRQNGAWKCF